MLIYLKLKNYVKINRTPIKYSQLTFTHSVSLGTDPPLANHNPVIFSVPQALKNLKSSLKLIKSPDNSNIFLIFNNNAYTDLRTAYKHIFILSYVIQVK